MFYCNEILQTPFQQREVKWPIIIKSVTDKILPFDLVMWVGKSGQKIERLSNKSLIRRRLDGENKNLLVRCMLLS